MPIDSSKDAPPKNQTKSNWIKISTVIAVIAVFLGFVVDGPLEASIALILIATLGYLTWKSYSNEKQAKKEFETKEEQMRFIFDSVPIGLHWANYRVEEDGAFVENRLFNPAHRTISGLSVEEMKTPGAFEAITHPDDIARQKEVRKQLTEGDMKEVALEKRYLRKDGKCNWVKVSWKRQYDEGKAGFQEISCVVDITAIKEADEKIRRKEAQLRVIFESVPIGLHWSDVDVSKGLTQKNFLERIVNPAHNLITGLSDDKINVPGIYNEITPKEDLEIQEKGIKETLDKQSGSFSMDKRYIHPDGKVVWVSITWIRDWDKDLKRYQEVSTLVDITEQKQFAERMEQARVAAEEANISKSQFLATMSHEIRTPMNGMIGMLHLLEPHLEKENLKYLRIAQNSAGDLLALINDILDFSKIEAGKMELESRDLPIDESIEQASEIHANNAFEKGLNLRCAIDPEAAVQIQGDPPKLRQVLSNLLSNAVKFTERGEIVIGARMITETEYNDTLEIFVEDTGIGLTKESKDKLFQAFTQANASTTRKYGGTGLGLSISKSIIENMGGTIGVDSKKETGSTFWIRFPAVNSIPLHGLVSPLSLGGRSKSLIIERCEKTVGYLQVWLAHWGCQSWVMNDSQSALEFIRNQDNNTSIDTLFINEHLFSKDEKAWQEAISTSPALRKVQLVSLARLTNEQSGTKSGPISARLRKPIRITQLRAILERHSTPSTAIVDPKFETDDLSEIKVLVVEDIMTNRIVVTRLLALKHNITADTANNGIEAIESIKKKSYDLVLMDCMMPEMDGYEATRAIRKGEAGEENRDLPIIALTANAMQEDQDACIAAGMSGHLSKPMTPEQIRTVLQTWAGKRDSVN